MKGITAPQELALAKLAAIVAPGTYLAGGVAVAIRFGHRQSLDLDLFVPDGDPALLTPELTAPSFVVLTRQAGTLYLEVDGVPASVLRYAYPSLRPPERIAQVPIEVASIEDLAAMKLSAIASRGKARDFWDLQVILSARATPLAEALDRYRQKYAAEDIGHVVRSLSYFADAEAEPLPRGLTAAGWEEIARDLRARVLAL